MKRLAVCAVSLLMFVGIVAAQERSRRGADRDERLGLLGMDVLSQAAEVTIDFRSMTLTLH